MDDLVSWYVDYLTAHPHADYGTITAVSAGLDAFGRSMARTEGLTNHDLPHH